MSDDILRQINKVEFSIFSNREILQYSVLDNKSNGIEITELFEKLEPKYGGLIDPRLGPISNNMLCATCHLSLSHCPGHFGHIKLAESVYHVEYLTHLKKTLECICISCSKLLIEPDNEIRNTISKIKNNKDRFIACINSIKNVKNCPNCGDPIPKIRLKNRKTGLGIMGIVAEYETTNTEEQEVKILKR